MTKSFFRAVLFATLLCNYNNAFANSLFGSIEFVAKDLSAIPRWERTLEKIKSEQVMFKHCDDIPTDCDSAAVAAWRNKLKELKGLSKTEKLEKLNSFANQWAYRTDQEVWGKSDYWASPKEFMINSGDCEDYAILKYVSLKELGFKNDVIRRIAHAVLAVKMNDEFYIMDSLFDAVLPHDQVMQYVPYYSVNSTTRWTHVMPTKN